MKKSFFLAIIFMGLGSLVMAQGSGASVNGKKGGSASAGNKKVEAKGSKGGSAKVDKSGVKIKGKNGGGVQIGKKQ